MIKKIELIKIFDIPIKLDLSWFIILAFITWTLAQNRTHTQHFSVELMEVWLFFGVESFGVDYHFLLLILILCSFIVRLLREIIYFK